MRNQAKTLRNQAKTKPLSDRQGRADDRALNDAIKEHGRFALGRLSVQRSWALEDVAEAEANGDSTRAAMKQARVDRLERVIAELWRTGRGQ